MRLLYQELKQLCRLRFWGLFLAGAGTLGALFPLMSLSSPDLTISQLFGTSGILYGLLLTMATMVVPLGGDFAQRTFQQKIAQGGSRVSLTAAGFCASLLGAAGVAVIFPGSAVLFTRLYCGWATEQGKSFGYLLGDSRFHASLSAYVAALLAVGGLCFFITALCRDLAKSLGFSTGAVILGVMVSQKALDWESLSFLRPVLSWTPIYQLLRSVHQAAIAPENMRFLLFTSGLILAGALAASCLALARARLK